ncbi:alkaline phosphatase D family protein [Maribellus maritimus]|uniref:alkaline phosphatase D family protein n=1 Tax=Maribellus maritimus TaxID=2870838 RepID=UPI001EEBCF17|nr:alkaline phosphatase D family protein [Maribellus maritimus]MCG6186022.1 alkaline phosphatase D family protein [Maribellus maritimus]
MNKYTILFQCCFFLSVLLFDSTNCFGSESDTIVPRYKVTLPEAHVGNLDIDTRLLDSYGLLPENIRQFYFDARSVFFGTPDADFTNPGIIAAARKYNLPIMGGPMLGKLNENSVNIWIRPSTSEPLVVKVKKSGSSDEKSYTKTSVEPGVDQRIVLDSLSSATEYEYTVYTNGKGVAEGSFTTTPASGEKNSFRIAFGSCFHKIGLHNPNLINQILKREPQAMMLLGDIAVDDRENRINLHRSDYMLRDVSKPWKELAANVPLYTSWDDHDYYNNDLSGTPKGFTTADREAVRAVWQQNWNNPENKKPGIYFNSRIGPVEIIMLDTRSCRENGQRGRYGSYLGPEQLTWLKETLKSSEAPFKIVSSGTMWSDYVSNGKDSWGTWDTKAREEIFAFIESEKISGVLLISGDRHGARGFTIPRPSGFEFYEFEAASLGGVPGPDAMAKESTNQLFGYHGTAAVAFGEFTFDIQEDTPAVTFRLIDQFGNILEKYTLPYKKLTPP